MFEVGTATTVRAFHVMPDVQGPEGERHSHDYRLEAVVRRARLDERGMVCDLDVLDRVLGDVAGRLADQDLDDVMGSDGEPVTVEVFSRWLHEQLSGAVASEGGEELSVRVWESPVAFGGYAAPPGR